MKLSTLLVAGSLAANAALLCVFASRPSLLPPSARDFLHHDSAATARSAAAQASAQRAAERAQTKASADAVAHFWSTLDSSDLKTLIAHLRAAGFSPAVIRSIVNARVDARLADRKKALAGSVIDTPFWKPEPMNMMTNAKFFEEMNQIYRDRSRMLREALGDDFFAGAGTDPAAAQRRQFGSLSKEKIDLVQRVNDDYAEMTSQIRTAMQGITLPEDREKLALLEREKHADLAAILTPDELEAYEMRTSRTTMMLRSTLTFMDATEGEFRTIYQIQKQFADVLFPTSGSGGPELAQQRRDAQKQIADQVKAALGDARYAEYARASNGEFQRLSQIAQRESLPAETAIRVYNLRDSIAQESTRIYNDTTQSADDKRAALQTLAQNSKNQIISSLGATAGNAYVKSANWLTQIERGGSVTFGPDGSVSNVRFIPAPRPSPATPRN